MGLPNTFDEIMKHPCIVLGLSRHSERWQYSVKKLVDAGFNKVGVFIGVDGYIDDISGSQWRVASSLRAGEIGFTLSCLKLWTFAATGNEPYIVVFEDDVLPHPNIRDLGELWFAETPRDIDIIMMGNQMNPSDPVLQSGQKVILNCPFYCTHAYILTRAGAQKIMNMVDVILLNGGHVSKGDIFLKMLVEHKLINVACWNGYTVEKPFPTFTKDMQTFTQDTIVWKRDTGLFYQNFLMGTTLHGPKISYVYYE